MLALLTVLAQAQTPVVAPRARVPEPSSATFAPSHRNVRLALGSNVEVDLGDVGHDLAIDAARNLLYVSVPVRNEVVVIDMGSYQIVDRVLVGTRPHGIDLSADGSTLYCALHQASSVAYLDLDTRLVVDTVNVGVLLDHATTWDVAEGAPDRIFVSANPGSGGFAYIVQIDRANGNAAQRVASNRIIRGGPTFAKDPSGLALYVGEGFSPNSLYKLSLLQPNAPIILEDNHGSVSGTQHTAISPAGERAYTSSGQILSTSDFSQIGLLGAGASQIGSDGSLAWIAEIGGVVELWDTSTQLQVGSVSFPCSSTLTPQTLRILPGDSGVLVLSGGFVCGTTSAEVRSLAVTPSASTILSSQAFDVCLIVDPGSSVVQEIRATRNGQDLSALFAAGIQGMTASGEETLRVPGRSVEVPGANVLDVDVLLGDGTHLVARTIYESVPTAEF